MALREYMHTVYKLSNGQILNIVDEDFTDNCNIPTRTITFNKEKKGKYNPTGRKPTGRPKGAKNRPKPIQQTKKIRLGYDDEPADNIQ